MVDQALRVVRPRLPDRPDDELTIQVEECLRFLVIASEAGQKFFPLSKEVDEVWHELITETRDYQELCAALPTGRFLHHSGITLSEYAVLHDRRAVVSEMLAWIPTYVSRFGEFTPNRARHWVICTFLQEELGMTLAEINQLGRSAKL
ncbi:hypothetical protein Kfla_4554 [Kribbella flavida DSM 17836]|uniref:Uncharacterized protein n=1 Tax=Kribbella flavida (strain DSM 17836 / JCM 10339 / NBRC 14399) TaxID=479435 RepID=D2PXW8_KRIFD|nr:hypothetical protein [Kribbella flavida]ADB33574.1 hypothetical protein Kfla_4554 [Kribbella flavida DSM 17836]